MIDVSVIVPCYNAEKYLNKCLDSILGQTKKEFEIIAINDGSKDSTLEILNQYKEKYPEFVRVISQENQGLSVTRNNGIMAAEGKYLLFVDSDDYIKPTMLEALYNKAVEGDFDLVASDTDCIYPDKRIVISCNIQGDSKNLTLDEKKALFNMYPTVWNKLYKKELFNEELFFYPRIWFEDVLFSHKLIPNIKSIGVVKETFYQYFQNPTSITYTYSDKLCDIFTVVDEVVKYYKEKGIFDTYHDELEYMYVRYLFATYIKRLSKAKNKKKFREGVKVVKNKVNSTFPDYKKNPILAKMGLKGFYLRYFNPLFAGLTYLVEKNRMN